MPKIAYISKNFRPDSEALIARCNQIITAYQRQGYDLTLRQLYYQLVSRDVIPNTERSYKNLGSLVNDGRLAGLIDWTAIVDRTRNLELNSHWSTPAEIMASAAQSFAIDKWADQPYRPEVWVEKEALAGIIERVASQLDVPWFSCRGYTSQSEMWGAGRRLARWQQAGQEPIIFHLGDHDPSGIDMTRDIVDRLEMFTGGYIELRRLALNWDQIEQYTPPPNPAKLSDSRANGYVELYGYESWELDALEPTILNGLISDAVASVRDDALYNVQVAREKEHIAALTKAADRWQEVEDYLLDD